MKQWKLSPIDLASLDKWEEYTEAKEAMFHFTDSVDAPWTVVKSDCKKRARLNAMRYVLHSIAYDKRDLDAIGPVDPLPGLSRTGSLSRSRIDTSSQSSLFGGFLNRRAQAFPKGAPRSYVNRGSFWTQGTLSDGSA